MRRGDGWTLLEGNPGQFTATLAKRGYVAGEVVDLWIEGADSVYTELASLDGAVKLKRVSHSVH